MTSEKNQKEKIGKGRRKNREEEGEKENEGGRKGENENKRRNKKFLHSFRRYHHFMIPSVVLGSASARNQESKVPFATLKHKQTLAYESEAI